MTAKLITGSGNPISGSSTGSSWSSRRSPVATSFSFATAPMSPVASSGVDVCSLPWRVRTEPIRSFPCVRGLTSVTSFETVPCRTRKTLIRPANGSATVLNTNAAVEVFGISIGSPFFAGDGTPSTIRSRSAFVPRFFVATPHATGNTSPRVTASLSACATSSVESSWPSR